MEFSQLQASLDLFRCVVCIIERLVLKYLKNCVVTWSFSLINITGYYHDVVFNKALIDSATVFTYLIGSFHNFTFLSHRLNLIWRRVPVHAARDDFRIN